MSKRFLFLYSDTGSGHRSGAQAVARALSERYGQDADVALVDVFVASQRWPFTRFPDWYPTTFLRGRAIPWRIGYWLLERPHVMSALTAVSAPYIRAPFLRILADHPADVIVSFHAVPNALLARAVRHWGVQAATATVVLDFLSAPTYWFTPGLDFYSVPYAEMAPRARAQGIDGARIAALGMPIRAEILHEAQRPKAEVRQQLGIEGERPLVLLVGGGDGVGPLAAIVQQLQAHRAPATLVVIAGRNQRLRQHLLRQAQTMPNLRVLGFTEHMARWLRAADILVSKAGPNTLAEAFVMGLPTVLYGAIPGQEWGNVTLVRKHGAGIWEPGPRQSAEAILSLLASPPKRAQMAQQAASLATPEAAGRIAERLWGLSD